MNELLNALLRNYGLSEVPGLASNPEIIKMFHETEHADIVSDETAWCSACLIYYCKSLNYEHPKDLLARSWLKIGTKVFKPRLGDIAVLWRDSPTSYKGHVCLYISCTKELVYVLGGNQSNKINISAYGVDRVLGYRRLVKLSVT